LKRVRRPRHLLLFRIGTDVAIEIVRLLRDAMELERHVPRASRTGGER